MKPWFYAMTVMFFVTAIIGLLMRPFGQPDSIESVYLQACLRQVSLKLF
jgi:cytochrome b subunit of formate dehydrogenase